MIINECYDVSTALIGTLVYATLMMKLSRFDGGMYATNDEETGLRKNSTMAQLGTTFSLKRALNWFDLLLASLDCYTWVFGQNLLTPATMLGKITFTFDPGVIFGIFFQFGILSSYDVNNIVLFWVFISEVECIKGPCMFFADSLRS